MNLTYNPKSGHVKLNGAVIGYVEAGSNGTWSYVPYAWIKTSRTMQAPTRELLFTKIREWHLRQGVAYPNVPTKGT